MKVSLPQALETAGWQQAAGLRRPTNSYLSYTDENGWSVRSLNFFQRHFDCCRPTSTKLVVIVAQLTTEESSGKDIPADLKAIIIKSWKRIYPTKRCSLDRPLQRLYGVSHCELPTRNYGSYFPVNPNQKPTISLKSPPSSGGA